MENFLVDVRRFVGKVPFTKDAVALYYCWLDPRTPLPIKVTIAGALLYFLAPIDAIVDLLPAIGFADDAGVIATAFLTAASHINDDHRRQSDEFFNQ
jgi:uncharacterized membrane protein YkvA (DUF1232 family)